MREARNLSQTKYRAGIRLMIATLAALLAVLAAA